MVGELGSKCPQELSVIGYGCEGETSRMIDSGGLSGPAQGGFPQGATLGLDLEGG